jgi:ribulose-5-phosphate 4-epimerase/fuculose-1-phosphate aldolase
VLIATLGHGVLAFGPDAETTVSLLVALEEAAEAELRTALVGQLSAPPGHCTSGDGRRAAQVAPP